MLCSVILFYFVLFYFILFYFILFYFILFQELGLTFDEEISWAVCSEELPSKESFLNSLQKLIDIGWLISSYSVYGDRILTASGFAIEVRMCFLLSEQEDEINYH